MSQPLRIHLDCGGHTGRISVTMEEGDGWEVRAELDDCVVAHAHCNDWHQVERVRARLEARLRQPDPDKSSLQRPAA